MALAEGVNLTVGGSVLINTPKFYGYIHPDAFREMMGEEMYQELLARPKVVCEYDYEDDDADTK